MIESPILEEPTGQRGDAELMAGVRATEAQLAEVCGLANATAARLAELTAGLLRSGGWNQPGIRTPEHYLMWQCGISRSDAHRVVTVARRIGTWPTCAAAFAAGELSLEQASIIASCAPPAWADESTCHFAKVMTVHQLRHVLANYAYAPPSAATTETASSELGEECKRTLSFGATRRGTWRFNGEMPLDEGAALEQALYGCRDDLFHAAHPGEELEPGVTPNNIAWVDALMEMAERALANSTEKRPHHDRYRILWHHHIDPAGRPVLRHHQGEQVPEWMRRMLLCDATVLPVAHAAPRRAGGCSGHHASDCRCGELGDADLDLLAELTGGAAVNVGRAQRTAPERLRRIVEHRDGGCRTPGCTNKHWLHMHHVIWWENGGRTDSSNIAALCGPCHRAVHREELFLSGNADLPDGHPHGLVFKDRHGRILTGAAHVRPPTGPPDEAAHELGIHRGVWHHPLGERLRYDDVYFNGAPPPPPPPPPPDPRELVAAGRPPAPPPRPRGS